MPDECDELRGMERFVCRLKSCVVKVGNVFGFNVFIRDGEGNIADLATETTLQQLGTPNTIITGTITVDVAGTPEPLASESTIVKKVYIKALRKNSGYVAVGDGDVDATQTNEQGWSLCSEDPIIIEFADLHEIYVDAENNNDGITFIATAISS